MVAKPLLKWPGGKRVLLKHLLGLMPETFNRYYEPFMGGGALFFALQPRNATLSDTNVDLINCYVQVRDRSDDVIAYLSRMKNTENDYYRIRANVPRDGAAKAARLIYLTTLSFNGIHRLNLKGEFNVPYGHKTHLQPYDNSRIKMVADALSFADITCVDFQHASANAGNGDLVYFDPPYTVAHGNNGFTKYNDKIFSWNDQVRLARLATELARGGSRVVISNADHPSVHHLYRGFECLTVERPSVIAASEKFRRQITECIFFNER